MPKIAKALLTCGIFSLLFLGYFHEITAMTQDLGRHILTGRLILETKTVPQINLYSYTFPSFPFINHHWLSEIVFFLLQTAAGFSGLLFITTFVVVVAFFLQFIFLYKKVSFPILILSSILYTTVLFERTDLRPEIFSFFFLSCFIVILFINRQKPTKLVFILPLLSLLWVNMHIYFFVGIVVFFLFLVDHILLKRTEIRSAIRQKTFPKETFFLLLSLALSLAAVFINPNGISGALYPLSVFNNYGYSIEENQTVFFLWTLFRKETIFSFLAVTSALFFFLLLTIKQSTMIMWSLSIVFTLAACIAIRNFPLFVFATFIPFTFHADLFFKALRKNLKNKTPFFTNHRVLFLWLIFFLLFFLLIFRIYLVVNKYQISTKEAIGANRGVDFFLKHQLKGPIFNNFDIGSYLIYRLYPGERVFVDGRPEAYPASFFKNTYIPMQENPSMFEKQDARYRFNTIFFSHTDQTPWAQTFISFIVKNPQWKIIYLDDFVIILVKKTPKNAFLKEINLAEFPLPSTLDTLQLFRFANFFSLIQLSQKEMEAYQALLGKNPQSCAVLYRYSNLLIKEQNPAGSIYGKQFDSFCQ